LTDEPAVLIALRPGSRTGLCHWLRRRTRCKGERRNLSERVGIGLIDGMRQLGKAPLVPVWDRLNTHESHAMRGPYRGARLADREPRPPGLARTGRTVTCNVERMADTELAWFATVAMSRANGAEAEDLRRVYKDARHRYGSPAAGFRAVLERALELRPLLLCEEGLAD
jgi:hypothetical protein